MGRRRLPQHPHRRQAKCCEHRGRPCPSNYPTHFCRWCENLHCQPDQTPRLPGPDPWDTPAKEMP